MLLEVLLYLIAFCRALTRLFPCVVPRLFAKWIKSIWSMTELRANSRVLLRAFEICLYSSSWISLVRDLEKFFSGLGTEFESSARSTTESVALWPRVCAAQVETKSSTMFLPISTVGMPGLAHSLFSQLV